MQNGVDQNGHEDTMHNPSVLEITIAEEPLVKFLTSEACRNGVTWQPRANIPLRCQPMRKSEVELLYFQLIQQVPPGHPAG